MREEILISEMGWYPRHEGLSKWKSTPPVPSPRLEKKRHLTGERQRTRALNNKSKYVLNKKRGTES